jgi:TonB-dependent starch-binding outer membrane protein SusC
MRWISVLLLSLLLVVPQSGYAQATGTISGVVTGTGGRPLTGASVAVAGTSRGTQTDAQGRFTITAVPAGSRTVRATFAGYTEANRTVTVAAGQTATLNITLTAQALALEGVVATGYATQRRQDVTGAVVGVQQENIASLPVAGATQALAAQIPGVNVITSTGAPGAGAQVQVRGVSAVGAGSTPLYVVDGFPITGSDAGGGAINFTNRNPLNDIPPNDIESITVLKDASAAAIYGSRASNGVVIITTKKGRATNTPRIDINAYTGWQSADMNTLPQVANATEFATFMNRRFRQLGGPIPAEWQNPASYGEGTNWFDEVLVTAPMTNVTASLSGGSERVRGYFSAGYFDQDGVLLNSGYKRGNVRANLDADINDWITVGLNVAPTYTVRSLNSIGGENRGGGLGSAMVAFPTDPARDASADTLIRLVRGTPAGRTLANPIIQLTDRRNDQTNLRMLGTSYVNLSGSGFLEGVQFRSSVNLDWQDSDTETFNPSTIWGASGPSIPSGSYSTSGYLSWLNENTVNVDRMIGENSRLQVLAGATFQEEIENSGSFNGSLFPDDDIQTLNAAQTITGNTGEQGWSLASVLGRVNYTLLDRYVLTGTIRSDGSSRFGSDNRWGTFPSAAVAWNVSREPFLENVNFVQDLKIRASLGYTGNNQIGNYPSLGVVNRVDYVFNNAAVAGRNLNTLQNPELGWERTREINLGVDAFFLDHRAGLTVDLYRRKTEDLLLNLELPTASGFGSVTANQGSVQNQGLEVGLNTTNLDTRNFRWTTNLNGSITRNKALDLGASDTLRSGASMESANTHITVVGQPIALFYGYKIIGVYSQADINNACVLAAPKPDCVAIFPGAKESDVRFKDVNGDGIIRQTEDFEVIGTPYPDFTWGMTNTMTYGPLDLRFTLDGSVGGQRLNRNLASIENIDGPFNVTKAYVQNMWISPDSTGDGLTPGAGGSSAAGRRMFRDVSDRWVEDAGFVWMRNVTLRYNLPSGMLFNARNGSVYLGLQNPWIWSSFHGNPQVQTGQTLSANGSSSSTSLTPGVDNFSYPLARTLTIGIDLGL